MIVFPKGYQAMRRRQIFASLNQPKEPVRENEKGQETSEKVLNACPKCGRSFTRGLHLHVKHCKG